MKYKNDNIGKDEVTIIGAGVILEGKLSSNGNIRVDGSINGDIAANGNVTIGETGEISGEIKAEVISIGGRVVGSINAKEKAVLESKAILKGDIITKILVVEAGAIFDGNSKMSDKATSFNTTGSSSSNND
jgi:cytoskeletal protein CcmA (bactofilin family)